MGYQNLVLIVIGLTEALKFVSNYKCALSNGYVFLFA